MTRALTLLSAFFLAASGMVCVASPAHAQGATKKVKVGLVLPGPITDGTFNTAAYKGIKVAEKKYPQISVSIRENTAMSQVQSALLDYARAGYDIVIGHGYQFAQPALKIHKQFPKTWFIITTAKVGQAPNLASFDNRWGDGGYVAGALAALITKSGIIATIGGIPVPTIKEYNLGFERGAKRMNPKVKVLSGYVGSFTDVAKGKEMTLSFIQQGADVVTATGNENVIGTLQAAKEKHVMMIGTAFDNSAMAPNTVVATALINFDVDLEMGIGKVLNHTIKPKSYVLGFNENGVGFSGYGKFASKISPETKTKIRQLIADIKAGKIKDLPKAR